MLLEVNFDRRLTYITSLVLRQFVQDFRRTLCAPLNTSLMCHADSRRECYVSVENALDGLGVDSVIDPGVDIIIKRGITPCLTQRPAGDIMLKPITGSVRRIRHIGSLHFQQSSGRLGTSFEADKFQQKENHGLRMRSIIPTFFFFFCEEKW